MPQFNDPTVLIVDDEPDIRELLEITLSRMGIETNSAGDVKGAIQALQTHSYTVVLTDLKLPDGDGLEILHWVQEHKPQLPVAVFTAHGNMDIAINAMKSGAFDFISKPVELTQLRKLIDSAVKLVAQEKSHKPAESTLLGHAPSMVKLRNQIQKVCRSQAPIFISGESGTGKELVARAIHYQGPRANHPFIPVNCGAIPSELMESEFFGHKKGSFTGASGDKQGLFSAANGGTLFLDEVADLPLDMQVKLLRAIQEKSIRPVGSEKEIAVDIRILSATHKDLPSEIESARFRNDLFYRINVIQIDIPSLQERPEDISELTTFFLQSFAESYQLPTPDITPEALKVLASYSFPGNVRELENILERAFTLCENNTITLEDLQLPIPKNNSDTATTNELGGIMEGESLDQYLEEIEKEIICNALKKNKWNRTATAKELGISFRSFRYRLKKMGLDD